MKTQKLVAISFFLSLAIILTRFFSPYLVILGSKAIRFDLGEVVIVFASFLLGPLYGLLLGFLADFIGANMFPVGPYFWGYTLDVAMIGLISGTIGLLYQRNKWFNKHPKQILMMFMVSINILIAIILIANINSTVFSNPQIKLTPQLVTFIILGFIAYFTILYLIITYLAKKQQNQRYYLSTILILSIFVFIKIPITPIWISYTVKTNYLVMFIPRVLLCLPYLIVPIFFLTVLLRIKKEHLW